MYNIWVTHRSYAFMRRATQEFVFSLLEVDNKVVGVRMWCAELLVTRSVCS